MSKLRNTPSAPRRSRHTTAVVALVGGSLAAGMLAACSADAHDPTSPAAPRSALYAGTTAPQISQPNSWDTQQWLNSSQFTQLQSTWRTSPSYAQPGTRVPELLNCGSSITAAATSITVYPSSVAQTFMLGRATTITVPAGAVTAPLTISASATVSQAGIQYDFQPHGTQFAKPLTISTNYQGCTMKYSSPLNFYYVNSSSGILQTMPSTDNRPGNTIQALTDHFSGFLVAWS